MLWMIVGMSITMGSFCGGATGGSFEEANVLKTNHFRDNSLEPNDEDSRVALYGNVIEADRMGSILSISDEFGQWE